MSYQLVYQDSFDTIDTTKWDKLSQTVCQNETVREKIIQDPDNANNNVVEIDGDFDYTGGCRAGLRLKLTVTKPYKIQFKTRWSSQANSQASNITIGKDANGNIYFVHIGNSDVSIAHILENQIGDTKPTNDISVSASYEADTWYTVEIEVLGDNTVNVSVNGTQVLSYQLQTSIDPEIELWTPEGGLSLYDDFALYEQQQTANITQLPIIDNGTVYETTETQTQVGGTATTGTSFWWIILLIIILLLLGLGTRRR